MKDSGNIWYLEEVNLFEYFCPVTGGQEKYDKLPKRSYKKGEFVYFSEDTSDKVFFIHSGAVKIGSYTNTGEEMIKTVLHPGEVFGELALFGEEKRADFALAMEDTELCVQERETIEDLMKDIKGFALFLQRLMGQRIIYTQKRLESLLFKDAKTRISEYVLDQARRYGKTLADGAVKIRNYLTHQEIANFTGTSRQTVTTVLNQLRDERLIDFDRKRIIIRNLNGMKDSVAA
ncbi:MAG: Crp/Fnr family transcriptional regulator [Bacteroidia bacterium]|nr:Crp/Fnr family transcriptional regulator [Bacteroidia bacterium]